MKGEIFFLIYQLKINLHSETARNVPDIFFNSIQIHNTGNWFTLYNLYKFLEKRINTSYLYQDSKDILIFKYLDLNSNLVIYIQTDYYPKTSKTNEGSGLETV